MGSDGVVLDPPVLGQDLGLQERVELFGGQQLVAEPAVERLAVAVCQGEPGSMNAVATSLNRHQSRIAAAVSSGPLSMRRFWRLSPGLGDDRVQQDGGVIGGERAGCRGGQRLAGELVDHVAEPDLSAIAGDVDLKVQRHPWSGQVAASRSPRCGPIRCRLQTLAGRGSPSSAQ